MFNLVQPPQYSIELQKIADLNRDERICFISKLSKKWLEWKKLKHRHLDIDASILKIIEGNREFSESILIANWAENMDMVYLDALDEGESEEVVQPLFYRARFAASLSCAREALISDKKLDELLYEFSFSVDFDTDDLMLALLKDVTG